MIKVAINGFGRIGRLALRIGLKKHKDSMEFVAINTSGKMDTAGWVHLFEYDTVYGKYDGEVSIDGDNLTVDGVKIPMLAVSEPKDLPWLKYNVDLVLECTGRFRTIEDVNEHILAGAKRVLLSAPPRGTDDGLFLVGINEKDAKGKKIFSNASCTTNCVGPVAKVILDNFGIEKAGMTTIHAVTSGQRMVDNSHKDLRRARAACFNIIPTTTGAAKSTGNVLPELKGKFDGIAIRVPILTGSLVDFTFIVKKKTTVEEVNEALEKASKGKLKGILGITDKPLVSSDIIGCEYSSLVNSDMTRVIGEDLVKILSWYDNEWGYVVRMMELAIYSK